MFPILVTGSFGVGKSCVGAILYSLACQPGQRSPIFVRAATLIGWMSDAKRSDTGRVTIRNASGEAVEMSYEGIQNWMERAPLLVIDDLGLREGGLSESQEESLVEVIERRCGKPLVVTTNHTSETLATAIGGRANSRLRAGSQFRLVGPDRRISK